MNHERRAHPGETEAAREPEQRLARFMAGVSHDLKTPLNSVIGFTSVLLQGAEGLQAEQLHQLRLVAQSANRLLGRLDALVEFFRLRAGIITPRPDWFVPGPVITRVLEATEGARTGKDVVEGALPGRIRADARLFERVMRELVANGNSHGGGVTRLVCGCQDEARPETMRLQVDVHDEGPGLASARAAAMVRSLGPVFLAGDDQQDKSYQELGLGLALAREAAGLLGGWIELESQEERGCRFSLVLELPRAAVED